MRYKIYKDGEQINIIIAEKAFCEAYCEKNGYTFEEDVVKPVEQEATDTEVLNALLGVSE